jgi:hypothetical protein
LTELATAHEQVAQTKHSLTLSQQQAKQTLAQLAQKKKGAENDLQQHMTALGMDHKRLEKVEGLAALLKEAGIPDEEIGIYSATKPA